MQLLGATLTIEVLFSLFQVRNVEKGKQVSFSSQPMKKMFELFTSNFKQFKDHFFKALAFEHEFPFFLDERVVQSSPSIGTSFQRGSLVLITTVSPPMTKLCSTSSPST